MLDDEINAEIDELTDEFYEAHVEDQAIRFWEGAIIQTVPTGAPPEYITVEIEGFDDENVNWRGVPASLVVGDEVLVWENPVTHRREIAAGSGTTGTSTSSPWQKVTVAPFGGDFALLSAAIAWIDALPGAIGPAAARQFAVNVLGGTFGPEAADVIISQYIHVGGEGEGTVIDMGDATLRLAADSSLQEIIVTSTANDNGSVIIVQGNNAVIDDVRVIITDGPNQECVFFDSVDNVELYHVVCETTYVGNSYAFNVYHSTVLFWDCHVDDKTNFWLGLYVSTAGNPSTVTTKFCDFYTSTHDIWVLASNVWNHFACNFDPVNVTIAGTENALHHGRTRFADKVYAGTFGAPVDTQVTRAGQYGFELHYSGNNYNVTALRVRASLITTDAPTRHAIGGRFTGAGNDDVNASLIEGAYFEALGKGTTNATTIDKLVGIDINPEYEAFDVINNYKGIYLRCVTDARLHGFGGTSYGIYLYNQQKGEADGGQLDAGIWIGTNLTAPQTAYDYCIDMSNSVGHVATADIRLSSGGTIGGAGGEGIEVNAAEAITLAGPSMTVPDDWWVGLGGAAGRLEFDNQATDEANFRSCNVFLDANMDFYPDGTVIAGEALNDRVEDISGDKGVALYGYNPNQILVPVTAWALGVAASGRDDFFRDNLAGGTTQWSWVAGCTGQSFSILPASWGDIAADFNGGANPNHAILANLNLTHVAGAYYYCRFIPGWMENQDHRIGFVLMDSAWTMGAAFWYTYSFAAATVTLTFATYSDPGAWLSHANAKTSAVGYTTGWTTRWTGTVRNLDQVDPLNVAIRPLSGVSLLAYVLDSCGFSVNRVYADAVSDFTPDDMFLFVEGNLNQFKRGQFDWVGQNII